MESEPQLPANCQFRRHNGAVWTYAGHTRRHCAHHCRSRRENGSHPLRCDSGASGRVCGGARVDSTFGRVDILVNNAGVGGFTDLLHELAPEEWDRILNTNLRSVYYTIRAFAPMMIRAFSGHIINISSLSGKNALPRGAAYAASKWGLNGLTYSVAEELRGA